MEIPILLQAQIEGHDRIFTSLFDENEEKYRDNEKYLKAFECLRSSHNIYIKVEVKVVLVYYNCSCLKLNASLVHCYCIYGYLFQLKWFETIILIIQSAMVWFEGVKLKIV